MSKNEYRRAFIMLRPMQTGYSGHARLERRTMTGSLYFIVTAQGEGLNAALVGQRSGEYYAAPLGALKRDARGQLTLAYAFDPRNIGGRPLEAYQLLAVAQVENGECRLVLTGNVEGSYPMDAAAVREAVCALYRPQTPAADIPAPQEPEPEPEAPAPQPEAAPEPEVCPVPEPTPEPEPEPAPEPEPEPEPARTKIYTRMRNKPPEVVTVVTVPAESAPEVPKEEAPILLPEAPCALPLEDGYTYIQTPLPAASGLGWCLVGVRTTDGQVTSVRCAMPGAYAPQPPEGLTGCVWVSPGDGSDCGYWVYTEDCGEGD